MEILVPTEYTMCYAYTETPSYICCHGIAMETKGLHAYKESKGCKSHVIVIEPFF